jgi:hypothetical protein
MMYANIHHLSKAVTQKWITARSAGGRTRDEVLNAGLGTQSHRRGDTQAGRGNRYRPRSRPASSWRWAQALTSPPSIATASRPGKTSGVQAKAGMPSSASAVAFDAS